VFPGAGNGDAWKIGVRSGARTEALLIITGSTGAGKTSVLAEASDILALQIVPAAVDLDALGLAHLPSETANDEVMYGSLQSACSTVLRSRGRERFWLARNGRAR
jgi:predicted ATP-binding protein involved in virulence